MHAQRLLAFLLPISISGAAFSQDYTGSLSGTAEAPPNASPGIGTTTVTLDLTLKTLSIDVTFSGLVTGNTAAHIHCCIAPNGTVGVATQTPTFTGFPSGVTSGTYTHSFDMNLAASYNAAFLTANGGSTATAFTALSNGIAAGQAYLNIHTVSFPGGEIRSFLRETSIFVNGFEATPVLRR
ncbi:MAG: CHRD domain-containing protein [Tahibacter sp.]